MSKNRPVFLAPRGTTQQGIAEFLSAATGGRVELVDTFADGVDKLRLSGDRILVGDEGFSRSRFKDLSLFPITKDWIQKRWGEGNSRSNKALENYLRKHNLESAGAAFNGWDNRLSIAIAQNQGEWKRKLDSIIESQDSYLVDLKKRWFPDSPSDENSRDPTQKCGMKQVDGFIYSEPDEQRGAAR